MTSTDFAAKYRLLKNVATRGARSFLAQQVELGRMVMVHYLDSENVEERAVTLERLEALRPPGRDKLLEITEVDGTPVAVTLFISSFKDFATWLDSVGTAAPSTPASQPGEFTRAFSKPDRAPAAPPPAPRAVSTPEPAREKAKPKKTPGEFTRIFGKLDEVTLAPAEDKASIDPGGVTSPRNEDAIPTVIMEAVKPAAKASPESAKPAPTTAMDSGPSFTAIFGALGTTTPAAPELPPPLSAATSSPAPVMPPVPPPLDLRPATPSPAPQPAAAPGPGEFTQLFQRQSPSGGTTPPPSFGAAPVLAPEVPRPIEPTPRADLSSRPPAPAVMPLGAPSLGLPALGAPSLGGSMAPVSPSAPKLPEMAGLPNAGGQPTAPPVIPPVPVSGAVPPRPWGVPATPPAIGASVFGNKAPSEFTRILSPIAAPPPPPVSIQPPVSAAQSSGGARSSKSMLPLIIGLAAVVVLTVAMVVYFVLRH